jgi:signal transduction histidine kinase
VIERMNGTVTVDSQVGRGTTFQVLLPAAAKEGRVA